MALTEFAQMEQTVSELQHEQLQEALRSFARVQQRHGA
jgi:hypothetical protein